MLIGHASPSALDRLDQKLAQADPILVRRGPQIARLTLKLVRRGPQIAQFGSQPVRPGSPLARTGAGSSVPDQGSSGLMSRLGV